MKRKIKKLLEKFTYPQYTEGEIVKLLEDYPSFVKILDEVAKAGVKKIEIGDHNPHATKPSMEILHKDKVVIHRNGHYEDE